MKKVRTSVFFVMLLTAFSVSAASDRTARGLSEAEQLGITAGTALACNAGAKLDDFELIASRIIANKALTAEAEEAGYRDYAEAKLRAYQEQKNDPQETCGEVLASFNHLPIFRSIVYADGGLKMYDGTFLKPQRPVTQKKAVKQSRSKTAPRGKSAGVRNSQNRRGK